MPNTVFDDKFVPLAEAMIEKYGRRITLVTTTTGEYDETTGEATVTTTSKNLKGVVRGPKKIEFSKESVQAGDMFVMLAAASCRTAPTPDDKLTFSSETWRIIGVESTYSGEQVCVYTVHVRR